MLPACTAAQMHYAVAVRSIVVLIADFVVVFIIAVSCLFCVLGMFRALLNEICVFSVENCVHKYKPIGLQDVLNVESMLHFGFSE